ncbi:MAG: prepilin-type N-terminal cleavage/methylation domain-containing protein [Alphaproteobacteria bacterium]|nr:prepilin-type N-terminal cleavage/methylation domain-containing protein [Alphaproteobacteria bacterium]
MKTPTFPTDQARRRAAGFTLVELLAVLAILSLAAGATIYASGRSIETARFRAFLLDTSAALTEGRTTAIRSTNEVVFQIDTENRKLGYFGGGPVIDVPSNVELKADLAADETRQDGTYGIRFYPTGSSSGGTLAFSYRGQVYEIRVNWLTGNVSTHKT